MSGSDARRQVVADAGGVALIVKAMGEHAGSVGVQEQACRALANLMNGSDARKQAVADAGSKAMLQSAVKKHPDNAAIQDVAGRLVLRL